MTTDLRRLVTEFYPPAPFAPPIRRELRQEARAVAVRRHHRARHCRWGCFVEMGLNFFCPRMGRFYLS